MSLLSDDLLKEAAFLDRHFEAVRAVMGTEENRFAQTLAELKRMAIRESLPIAVIGGLAAIHYGYAVSTQDVDVVVGRADLDRLLQVAPNYGFKIAWRAKTNWHTLTHGDVEINVVPEGERSHAHSPTTIPSPAQLGVSHGMEYASFPGWIELKISSGRRKDLTHVVEALKRVSDEMVDQARAHMRAVDPSYFERFEELAREATEEKQQERHEE
jgi:hypothetical protein